MCGPILRRLGVSVVVAIAALTLVLPACTATRPHPSLASSRSGSAASPSPEFRSDRPLDLMPNGRASAPSTGDRQPGSSDRVYVSPDGQWIAVETGEGSNRAVAVGRREGSGLRRISGGRPAISPRWSPDSDRVLYLVREFADPDAWGIWVYDLAASRTVRVASAFMRYPHAPAWFPDGRRFCYASDRGLVVVDAVTRQKVAIGVPAAGRIIAPPAVSPDGRRVGVAVEGSGVWVASVPSGRVDQLAADGDVDGLAWAPGGRELALRSARDGTWRVQVIR